MPKPANMIYKTLYYLVCAYLSNCTFYKFRPCSGCGAVLLRAPSSPRPFSRVTRRWPANGSWLKPFSRIAFYQRKLPYPSYSFTATPLPGQHYPRSVEDTKALYLLQSVIHLKSHPGSRTHYVGAWDPCCNSITSQLLPLPSPASLPPWHVLSTEHTFQ